MAENFLTDPTSTPIPALPVAASNPQPLQREPLKVLLIGSPKGVTRTIHTFHRLGFAEVGEWSPLLPTQNPKELLGNKCDRGQSKSVGVILNLGSIQVEVP